MCEKEVKNVSCMVSPSIVSPTPGQDPAKADKITKIQRDLDETTEVLVRNITETTFAPCSGCHQSELGILVRGSIRTAQRVLSLPFRA